MDVDVCSVRQEGANKKQLVALWENIKNVIAWPMLGIKSQGISAASILTSQFLICLL